MQGRTSGLVVVVAGIMALAAPAPAQAQVKAASPGFNLFSVQRDIELGQQSAVEAEKQLQLLNDASTNRYLNQIIQRLAAAAPGAKYPYHIKAVNAAEINAFALPGGPMYVNRGLIEAARSEGELAGVLAHEMSHVAMRHGTHQASKAYLSQAGLGILGGLLGKSTGTAKVINTIGGVGLNAVFLKFSRDDESEADEVGAQIMAKAGYDPMAMASLFELLRTQEGHDPSKLERFLSDHPASADREAHIRQLAPSLGGAKRTELVGGFTTIQSRLRGVPAGSTQATTFTQTPAPSTTTGNPIPVNVAAPSSRLKRFAHPTGFFTIDYPDNWLTYPSGYAVSIAPQGGVVTTSAGQQSMIYGIIVNHYAPFEGTNARRQQSLKKSYAPFEDRNAPRGALEDATDDLVRTVLASNPHLQVGSDVRSEVIDGAAGFSLSLRGRSPVTQQDEQVALYTRALPDGHVIYALGIAPGSDTAWLGSTFPQVMRTLAVNDNAAHRTTRTSVR